MTGWIALALFLLVANAAALIALVDETYGEPLVGDVEPRRDWYAWEGEPLGEEDDDLVWWRP